MDNSEPTSACTSTTNATSAKGTNCSGTAAMSAGPFRMAPLPVGQGTAAMSAGPVRAAPLAVGQVSGASSYNASTTVRTETSSSDREYIGTVKSYNERRGFGFIACAEVLAAYGRDVYMAKTEVNLAAGVAPMFSAATHSPAQLAEHDIVRFQVRLSFEGYPQASQVRRLCKYRGIISETPVEEGDIAAGGGNVLGTIISEEFFAAHGQQEVAVRREACGQIHLCLGDMVTFCVPEVAEEDGNLKEARLVVMMSSKRCPRAVLSCFSLRLPRPPTSGSQPAFRDLRLDCHAFNDKIIIAGLPHDMNDMELKKFFTKQGATGTISTRARGCGYASISFPSTGEVTRFLSRTAHAFSDDRETRIASLLKCRRCANSSIDSPRLPALPAPSLTPGEEPGIGYVHWSPLVLAVSYVVELRPAGAQAPWSAVDSATGRLKKGGGKFGMDCSSCKVMGLDVSSVYEARVIYFTSCGCRAEASDPSSRCMPCPRAAAPHPGALTTAGIPVDLFGALAHPHAVKGGGIVNTASTANFGTSNLGACPIALAPSLMAEAAIQASFPWLTPLRRNTHNMPGACAAALGQQTVMEAAVSAAAAQASAISHAAVLENPHASSWRCAHGSIIASPPQPELQPGDEFGFAVSVCWPCMAHAAAYVVDFQQAGSTTAERFYRAAPTATQCSMVELRVGGLRPSGPLGQRYLAQVRSVAACGCESMPSPPGWSPQLSSTSPPTGCYVPQNNQSVAAWVPAWLGQVQSLDTPPLAGDASSNVLVAPSAFNMQAGVDAQAQTALREMPGTMQPHGHTSTFTSGSKPMGVHQGVAGGVAANAQATLLPVLLGSLAPPVPPPTEPPSAALDGRKEPPPELEECVFLD